MQPKVDLAAARPDLQGVRLHHDAPIARVFAGPPALVGRSSVSRHQPQQIGLGDVALREYADVLAVAQHGDPIG